ncbi:hypothetical protein AMS68_003360 [Peltaster fructicola]|uniref:SH3 domain-containing protein n=1 Tax=Peltaster fructicola TaxID=286661 RepID=A0A6H0XSZ7_9PEZI|nr:hypothetical protein AMS68_003360 [Peltaster fructicola]
MAALNLSTNGPSITASYQKIVNAAPPNGPAASSPTYGQWALFTVQAPLVSAFQQDSSKESVLKVQTTGESELVDLIEEFSDGRIQFAFVKVKDPNSGLPKSVLVGWCGEGVPERTKGYFTSHLNAVAKVLHGYHVQVTARSDRDLTPEVIIQKVADASGAKYTGGGNVSAARPPPPAASKPVLPTKSFGNTSSFQPLNARNRAPGSSAAVDSDGWGQDAPQVSRSQLEKVDSAYKPTKVDIAALQSQREPSRYQAPTPVDIAAIRRQAQEQGQLKDDRPSVTKGAYEPIGKVDINDIRRKAQAAPPPVARPTQTEDDRPQSLAERSSAFSGSERLTSLPKPKIENRFGSAASSFTGTTAPSPGGFGVKPLAAAAPVGTASKTFADEGGKTPAQLWAERKAREGGSSGPTSDASAEAVRPQVSGGWQSGYAGKKWGVQIPSRTGGSGVSEQRTGEAEEPAAEPASEDIGSIRDRFNEPPAVDTMSKPNASARGVPMPGLPTRPQADIPAQQHQDLPPPPPRPMPADEPEDEEDDMPQGQGSPVMIARPVARDPEPKPLEPATDAELPGLPTRSLAHVASNTEPEPEPQIQEHDPARGAGQAAAETTFGQDADDVHGATGGGHEAIAQFDYEKAEDNELELHEGERIVNIEMVDDDWWMGENSRGEKGLFPSNYVELQPETSQAAPAPAARAVPEPAHAPVSAPAPSAPSKQTATAVALYDYEAAEDNELSFPEGAEITDVEFPDEDWWHGSFNNHSGLFPANYVQLQE